MRLATSYIWLPLVLSACATQKPETFKDIPMASKESLLAAQKAGYSLVTRNGEQVLCRKELGTGSQLQPVTRCLTARDWERMRSSSREQLDEIRSGHKPACPPGAGCG